MRMILSTALLVLSAQAFSQPTMPQNPPAVYASLQDRETLSKLNSYGRVDELCPNKIEEYAKAMDDYQAFMDAVEHAPWPHNMLWEVGRQMKEKQEICYELKVLKRDYDLLLAINTTATEEQKQKVRQALDELHVCLQNAKKRSEIETCDTVFRLSLADILDL